MAALFVVLCPMCRPRMMNPGQYTNGMQVFRFLAQLYCIISIPKR